MWYYLQAVSYLILTLHFSPSPHVCLPLVYTPAHPSSFSTFPSVIIPEHHPCMLPFLIHYSSHLTILHPKVLPCLSYPLTSHTSYAATPPSYPCPCLFLIPLPPIVAFPVAGGRPSSPVTAAPSLLSVCLPVFTCQLKLP